MKFSHLKKLLVLMFAGGGMLAQTSAALITVETVPVGNAGNVADRRAFPTLRGSVGYDYKIGKFEVTISQYTAFLNAVALTDTYGLYNVSMGTDMHIAGISRSGSSGNFTYSVVGSGLRPISYVSWLDSARFANWLHNGQPAGLQTAETTEMGSYNLNGALSDGGITRSANATFVLPTQNEWYKAAYYDPSLNSSRGGYWLYPTRSNATPNSRNGSDADPNSANFYSNDEIDNGFNGGFAVTGTTLFSDNQNYLTEVGAFGLSTSYYGTFDQGGNAWEWDDTVIGLSQRGMLGGAYDNGEAAMSASHLDAGGNPRLERNIIGFRIAIVPEPSMVGLVSLGLLILAWTRK